MQTPEPNTERIRLEPFTERAVGQKRTSPRCVRAGSVHEPIGSRRRTEQQTLPVQAPDLVATALEQLRRALDGCGSLADAVDPPFDSQSTTSLVTR
jgi:hypothetical protein